jgi:hypothetical protein
MDRLLRENFSRKKTAHQLATALAVTVLAVRARTRKLGLRRFWQWTPKEDAYLRQHYLTATARELGKALGRKPEAVRARVRALGLKKNHRRQTTNKS